MAPVPYWRDYREWKIELLTDRVGDAWTCPQIRVTSRRAPSAPALLTLDGEFPSIFHALNAGEACARQWIDAGRDTGSP